MYYDILYILWACITAGRSYIYLLYVLYLSRTIAVVRVLEFLASELPHRQPKWTARTANWNSVGVSPIMSYIKLLCFFLFSIVFLFLTFLLLFFFGSKTCYSAWDGVAYLVHWIFILMVLGVPNSGIKWNVKSNLPEKNVACLISISARRRQQINRCFNRILNVSPLFLCCVWAKLLRRARRTSHCAHYHAEQRIRHLHGRRDN